MVRELFELARTKKACIIFFDEVDAIGGTRFDDGAGGDNEVQRTMLELINQLDGFDPRGNIKVLMATNRCVASSVRIPPPAAHGSRRWIMSRVCMGRADRTPSRRPDTLDPALLRPGRLDRRVEFGLPDLEASERARSPPQKNPFAARPIGSCDGSGGAGGGGGGGGECAHVQGRAHILRIHTQSMSVERNIRYELIARLCPNTTGAFARVVRPARVDRKLTFVSARVQKRRRSRQVRSCEASAPRLACTPSAHGARCVDTSAVTHAALFAPCPRLTVDRVVSCAAALSALAHDPQLATEKDFLEAVNKVIKGYKKFSATPRYMTYN